MSAPDPRRIQVDLSDRTAIVTGASRGIGQEIARVLAAAGAKVMCVARNEERLQATVKEIADAGGEAACQVADVSVTADVDRVVEETVTRWDRLDILVNNAGITSDTLIPRMSDEEWDRVIAANLRSVFLFTRAATQVMMRSRYGRIINMSSVSGIMGNPGQCNYSASKAGIIGLTQSVAREMASRRRNICVNAVCPGFISSEMTDALGEALIDEVKKRVPLQRLGETHEIADAVLYLASDSAAYLTGHVLVVDGGLTA